MPAASATKRGLGLRAKIFIAATLLVVAVLAVTFGVTSLQANRTADAAIQGALSRTAGAVENLLGAHSRTLAATANAAASVPQYRERLLNSRQPSEVLDQADDIRDLANAAWVLITDAEGVLIARTDAREQHGIDLSRGGLIAGALNGEETAGGWGDETTHKLYMAVGLPLQTSAEQVPRGVLVATYELGDSLAQEIRDATLSDVVFFSVDTTGAPHVVGSTIEPAAAQRGLASLDQSALDADTAGTPLATEAANVHLVGRAAPIRSAGGSVLGGFVALRSREAELAAFKALQRTILAVAGLGVLLALVAAFALARNIATPVQTLVAATRQVQDGDYSVEIPVQSRDEIGALGMAFRDLVGDLKEKAALVEYMMGASGAAPTQPIATSAATVVRQAGDALRPGSLFAGRYEVKEVLGMGGMGVVYRAIDRELQEPVAIKTLRPEALALDGVAVERFKQEIRLARKIAHRNVVRTYDLGELNGMYYLTMEFVEGTSLKQLIQSRGRLPVPVTLTIGKQLCRALEVAHDQGVIHRDIKPQNMVVDAAGFLKVMDFGIARLANPPKGKGLTEAGTSIGTPDYMSPEQLSGAELDVRSDLYSAGVVLFECVTGRVPFEADTTWALVAKHLEDPVPDPRSLNPEVPASLAAVILKAMAKQPADRYQSAAQLHDALG
jgi:eukaryotic-like serine/threonine-protein kinase